MKRQIVLQQLKQRQINHPILQEKDNDTSYDESTASKIELSGSSANVSGDGVTVSESTVTITKSGTYVISGQSDGVQIKGRGQISRQMFT